MVFDRIPDILRVKQDRIGALQQLWGALSAGPTGVVAVGSLSSYREAQLCLQELVAFGESKTVDSCVAQFFGPYVRLEQDGVGWKLTV